MTEPVMVNKEVAPIQIKPEKISKNNLPSDDYEPIFEPVKVPLREYEGKNGDPVRQSLIMKIMRNKYDDGKVYFYATMWQDSESYTGFMKGKTILFPIGRLDDVIGYMCEVIRECEGNEMLEDEMGVELPF